MFITLLAAFEFFPGERAMIYEIPGYLGYYVNRLGETFSNKGKGGAIRKLKLCYNNTGYLHVGVMVNSKSVTTPVHRLMAYTFLYNEDNRNLIVNHINSVRDDNRLENLELVTYRENSLHSRDKGRMSYGENHHCAKLWKQSVDFIRQTESFTQAELGRIFGVRQCVISDVIKNKTWVDYNNFEVKQDV